MTTVPRDPHPSPPWRLRAWSIASGVVAVCGIVMLVIDLASIPASGGDSPVDALGVLGVLGAPLVVLGVSFWSLAETALRNARLAHSFPDAHLVALLGSPAGNADLRVLQAAFGMPLAGRWLRYNATLVVDTRAARFFRGGRTPRLLLELPAAAISDIGVSRQTPAGTAAVERGWIEFRTPSGPIRQVYIFATTGLFPKVLHNRNLATELRTLSLAAGRTVSLEEPSN